jgi:hypothetical protein
MAQESRVELDTGPGAGFGALGSGLAVRPLSLGRVGAIS